MNDLIICDRNNLPAEPADLAKFIIVAQEKLNAVRAEIRAIKRLEMAKDVYDQKLEEMRELQSVTLLAYARMGEITREMPKDTTFRGNQHNEVNSRQRELTKTKAESLQEIGLSKDQVSRMEKMAKHPDIVEEVIQDAREGKVEATQTEVMRRIKEQESVIDLQEVREQKEHEVFRKIDNDYDNLEILHGVIDCISLSAITEEVIDSVAREDDDFSGTIQQIEEIIEGMKRLKTRLLSRRVKYER